MTPFKSPEAFTGACLEDPCSVQLHERQLPPDVCQTLDAMSFKDIALMSPTQGTYNGSKLILTTSCWVPEEILADTKQQAEMFAEGTKTLVTSFALSNIKGAVPFN